jgi:hypothetical protein
MNMNWQEGLRAKRDTVCSSLAGQLVEGIFFTSNMFKLCTCVDNDMVFKLFSLNASADHDSKPNMLIMLRNLEQ